MIHAGPYIDRTIRHHLNWATVFRRDAEVLESKAAEKRLAADECEKKAKQMAAGTDWHPGNAATYTNGVSERGS
jgi:hypothetical protein